MLELIAKVKAAYAAAQAGDYRLAIRIVAEIILASLSPQPMFASASPAEKEQLKAAFKELEDCCKNPPVAAEGAEAIDPQRWANVLAFVKAAWSILKMFI